MGGDGSKSCPGDAIREVCSQSRTRETRAFERRVACSPSDVWETPATNIAFIEMLEERMNSLSTFVLAAPIASARDDIVASEALSSELLFHYTDNIDTLLARAVADVTERHVAEQRSD